MSAKKYPISFYDCDGLLLVACAECTRGFNSDIQDKCGSGGIRKGTGRDQYCAIGTLMSHIDKATLRSLPRIIKHKTGDKKTCFGGTPCRGIDKCAGWDTCQKGRGAR